MMYSVDGLVEILVRMQLGCYKRKPKNEQALMK